MNTDALLYAVGKMFYRIRRVEVNPDQARAKFNDYCRALAEGRPAEELTTDEAEAIGDLQHRRAGALPRQSPR